MIIKKEEAPYLSKFRQLTGLNESKVNNNLSKNIVSYETLSNGITYAVIKERNNFVIKESKDGSLNEDSFDYIGGLSESRFYKYRYKNHVDAEKNFALFGQTINENYIDERREEDIVNDEVNTNDEESLSFDNDTQNIDNNTSSEPQVDVSNDTTEHQVDDDNTTSEVPEDDSDVENNTQYDDEINSDGEDENIYHYVGKLTSAIRNSDYNSFTPEKIKSILNSVISALPLNNLSPDERLKIARRVRKGDGNNDSVNIPESFISETIINEGKKIKEGINTMELCQSILDCIKNGQHTQSKELFNKLKNKEAFFNYLDGLDYPSEMIQGYKAYFKNTEPELDEEKDETLDSDSEITPETGDLEISNDSDDINITNSENGNNDDELFKKFIMKLAVNNVVVDKDTVEPDTIIVNGYKFIPRQDENDFTIISVVKDETTKMDFILSNDCYENTYKVLLSTVEEDK